jgi:hypothetical protein
LIRSIAFVWTIGVGDCWMVSVTLICTSCESPVSSTVTAKPRSVVAVTVFSVDSESSWFAGRATVLTIPVPCRPPPLVPPLVAAPWSRCRIASQ